AAERQVGDAGAVWFKWGIGRAEEAGLAGVGPGHMLRRLCEADKGRHGRIDWPEQLGSHRAKTWPAAHRRHIARRPASHALDRVVASGSAHHRADDREFVHHPRDFRKDLADLDSRYARGDGFKLPANLFGSLSLDVPYVLVRRTAAQEDIDDRLV